MLDHNPHASCIVGARYKADVPDTLDLADRMGLAINALTNVWWPEQKWALGFFVDVSSGIPVLFQNDVTDSYLNIPPKFLEALTLCRLASGSDLNLAVDRDVLRVQLDLIGEDGLTYCPTDTLPKFTQQRPFSTVTGEGRLLLALCMLAQVDDDPRWIRIAQRKVDRLLELAVEKEGYRYFRTYEFRPGEGVPPDASEPMENLDGGLPGSGKPVLSMAHWMGAVGHGAGLLYRLTGYEPALALSRGLARWALVRLFHNGGGAYKSDHFHISLYALMGVCEYGVAGGDVEVLERVDACYRWAREMGDSLTGFFPEAMPGSDWYLARKGNTVEICEVADMVFLALYLTRAGLGDYWDDIDRWVRNMYAQGQVRDAAFLDGVPEECFASEGVERTYPDDARILERSVGSFLGWMRANDGLNVAQTSNGPRLSGNAIMHCCTANGARTLYHVWHSIVELHGDEVRVNLLLNCASAWVDVDSYLPAEGKVVVHVKDARRIALRIPEWCNPHAVLVAVNGKERRVHAQGRYVRVGWLNPGDTVTTTLPVPERKVHRVLGEMPYTLTLRGADVTDIDPPGIALPLYRNQPNGEVLRRTRFVPEKRDIIW